VLRGDGTEEREVGCCFADGSGEVGVEFLLELVGEGAEVGLPGGGGEGCWWQEEEGWGVSVAFWERREESGQDRGVFWGVGGEKGGYCSLEGVFGWVCLLPIVGVGAGGGGDGSDGDSAPVLDSQNAEYSFFLLIVKIGIPIPIPIPIVIWIVAIV